MFRSITGVTTIWPKVEGLPHVCMVDDMSGGVCFKTHIPQCLQGISRYCLPQAFGTVLGLLTYVLCSLSALRLPRAAVVGSIVQLLPTLEERLSFTMHTAESTVHEQARWSIWPLGDLAVATLSGDNWQARQYMSTCP